jgi:hypothetical protein
MDVVKTRLMAAVPGVSVPVSVMGCILSILNEEGIGAFFKGSISRLLHKVPANGLFFLCFEAIKQFLKISLPVPE